MTNLETATVLFLSGDLMFASRVRSAAERASLAFKAANSLPEEQIASLRFVIVDLSTRSSLIPGIVEDVKVRYPSASLIAYGPHVQVDHLKAAREAGVPTVLTRGQFDSVLMNLFVGTNP